MVQNAEQAVNPCDITTAWRDALSFNKLVTYDIHIVESYDTNLLGM